MSRRVLFATGFTAGLAAILSVYAVGGDADLFYRNQAVSQYQGVPMVASGMGAIEKALITIVPAPYKVYLDDSVPQTMMLIWGRGDNWMDVLNRALAPVGLVAKPDWAKNSVTVAWRDQRPAGAAPAAIAAAAVPTVTTAGAPAAPDMVSRKDHEPAKPGNRMSGGFDAAPPVRVSAPEPVVKPEQEVWSAVGKEIIAGRNGELPAAGDMWILMKAAVAGKQIVLTGRSQVSNEMTRNRFANLYANRARKSLLAVGFPSRLVVVNERVGAAGSPRVTIAVMQGEIWSTTPP